MNWLKKLFGSSNQATHKTVDKIQSPIPKKARGVIVFGFRCSELANQYRGTPGIDLICGLKASTLYTSNEILSPCIINFSIKFRPNTSDYNAENVMSDLINFACSQSNVRCPSNPYASFSSNDSYGGLVLDWDQLASEKALAFCKALEAGLVNCNHVA